MTEPSPSRPVPGPPRPGPVATERSVAGDSDIPGGSDVLSQHADSGRAGADPFAGLETRPVAEHVEVFETEHARLERELGTIDRL